MQGYKGTGNFLCQTTLFGFILNTYFEKIIFFANDLNKDLLFIRKYYIVVTYMFLILNICNVHI